MTRLVVPHQGREEEWIDLVLEFDGAHMDGSGFHGERQPSPTSGGYEDYLAFVAAEGDPDAPVKPGWVKCSYFWITDDHGGLVGFLALRRSLTDFLLEQGGHVGYSVRPARRRQGHASRALALGLAEAHRLGIERVLVTCEEENEASRRTIEGNGGVYEDTRGSKRRYWITTGE